MLLHRRVFVCHELRDLAELLELGSTLLLSMVRVHLGLPQCDPRPEGKVRLVHDLRMSTFKLFHKRITISCGFIVEFIILDNRLLLEVGLPFNETLQLVDRIVAGYLVIRGFQVRLRIGLTEVIAFP